MSYFNNITGLSSLKRQYRALAKANHPDRGGDTAVMQAINTEFAQLFVIWKNRPDPEADASGYGPDGDGLSASEFQSRVYNEYRWEGENYKRTREYSVKRICEHIRAWLKETYPSYKFSVRMDYSKALSVSLLSADFYPFRDKSRLRGNLMNYSLSRDDSELTDRCREVMKNVCDYVASWNYDESDLMTDYFNVNFYADIEIGMYGRSFEYRPLSFKKTRPEYRPQLGPVGRAVRDAIGAGNAFLREKHWVDGEWVVDESRPLVLCKNDENHYHVYYSQPSLLKTRLEKIRAVGIDVTYQKGRIVLNGYSPELQAKLDKEAVEDKEREKAFYEKLDSKMSKTSSKTERVSQNGKEASSAGSPSVEIVDYSEKAFAVKGNTRPIATVLKSLGGKFNPRLSFGAGWIFSKAKEQAVREALALAG